MGTPADFYIGKGKQARYLGTVYMDGYPKGLDRAVRNAKTPTEFRCAVNNMLLGGRSAGVPFEVQSEPEASRKDRTLVQYTYVFDNGKVQASHNGNRWFLASKKEPKESAEHSMSFDEGSEGVLANFNSLSARKINGYTFQEWAQIAKWSDAAKRLTGEGYETPEIQWQMGDDPVEVAAENVEACIKLADGLGIDFHGHDGGMNAMKTHALQSGYAYKLEGKGSWKTAKDGRWDIEMYSPEESEELLGPRLIDGVNVMVFKTPSGTYAQTATACRAGVGRSGTGTRMNALSTSQRFPAPGLTHHHAFNLVYPPLSNEEAGRFATLASKISLSLQEFLELGQLYIKSGRYIHTTSHGVDFDTYLNSNAPNGVVFDLEHNKRGGSSRLNQLAVQESVVSQAKSNAPAIALGTLGVTALGVALYYAMKTPAAPAVAPAPPSGGGNKAPAPKPGGSKAPAPAPKQPPKPPAHPPSAPAAHAVEHPDHATVVEHEPQETTPLTSEPQGPGGFSVTHGAGYVPQGSENVPGGPPGHEMPVDTGTFTALR